MRKPFSGTVWLNGFAVALGLFALSARPQVCGAAVGSGTPSSCTEAALDSALAAGGTVTFDCGPDPVTITVTSQKIILRNTTVDGGGLITLSGGGTTRIVFVERRRSVTLTNLTFSDGYSMTAGTDLHYLNGLGGAICNWGNLSVSNSRFDNNAAGAFGGAINNQAGKLTVTDSTFSNNRASAEGGAINNFAKLTLTNDVFTNNHAARGGVLLNYRGTVKITNSRLDNNAGDTGGGTIYNEVGKITVTGSTFSNNSTSAGIGGAIFNYATVAVANSTFSNNSALSAGAVFNAGKCTVSNSTFVGNQAAHEGGALGAFDSGRLTVINSTLLSNSSASGAGGAITNIVRGYGRSSKPTVRNSILAGTTSEPNCGGVIVDLGYNLDSGSSCGLNPLKHSLSNTDPVLDPAGLADNGGPTQTIAVEAGSPAINAINAPGCRQVQYRDQRGFVRPGTGSTGCTIGAYEFNSPGPAN